MKKRFLAIAIAAGLASPFAANADATVYGKINLSVGTVDEGNFGDDNWQVRSHASRLGVKGSEDLGNGLSATYKLEYGVSPDEGATGQNGGGDGGLSRRNQYVGLKGGFGEIRVGRHDTPLKMSQGKWDQFNDMDGDLGNISGGENRLDNVVAYLNKVGNVKFAVAIVPGEGDGQTTGGDGISDTISAMGAYSSGPLYVALAFDSYDDTTGGIADSEGFEDRTRLTAIYKMGKMQFGFIWEDSGAVTGGEDADGYGLNFAMGMGKNKVKFQYITGEDDADNEATLMSLGYDWGLSKRTTAYVSYNDYEAEDAAGNTGEEATTMVAGMIHKF